MKVEYSENERKPIKKSRKRAKKRNRIIVAIVTVVLVLGVTVALMLTVLFNVNRISVVGSSIYTTDEIIYASGIMNGDNLIRLPSDEIEQRIEESLPYVKTAEVIKSFPNGVGIKVTPADESVIIYTEKGYYVADEDYKLLRLTNELPDRMLRIKGIDHGELISGQNIKFNEKQQKEVLKNLLELCDSKRITVDFINIESLVNIGFAIDGRLYIELGSYNDINGKLNHLSAMLDSVDDDISASISLVDWSVDNKQAVLKYRDISDLIK